MLKSLIFEDLAKHADPTMFLSVITPTHNVKNVKKRKFYFEFLRETSNIYSV